MITLRQLRYFEALARHLHFGRAADECGISQPALSQQIREMEEMLGIPLIERGSRRFALTPRGEEIAKRGLRILGDMRDLADFARHGGALLTGPLRLGVIPSVAPYLLPRALPCLQALYPALELQLRETRTGQLVDELLQGQLDAVLVALPASEPGIESRRLFEDRFLLAARTGSPEAAFGPATAGDIAPERLLLLEEGHCLRDQALRYCSIARTERLAGFGATSLTTIMQMVANGYGVTLLPELCTAVEARDPRIVLKPFAEPQPFREIGLAWRTSSPRRGDFEALADVLAAAGAEGSATAANPDTNQANSSTVNA